MFFDETMLLQIRLNILNKFIDKFIITESKFSHNGKEKKLNFDIKKFSEFKSKIEYIVFVFIINSLKAYYHCDLFYIYFKRIYNKSRKN